MAQSPPWTAADIPDQRGRVAVVTGANSGLGLETASALAGAGAHVVLACRDEGRARTALEAIRADHHEASLDVMRLDLASLVSVRDFAKRLEDAHPRLDLLVNNAGVMAIPRRTTADGFEMQLGTNHLGHFALTGLLIGPLLRGEGSRVVQVSSTAHRAGRIRFDDLHGQRRYGRWGAYAQSKLANLLFTFELARRLRAAGSSARSLASHPGYAATNLQFARLGDARRGERLWQWMNRLLAQDAAMGALPSLYAATAPEARSGDYIGPGGLAEAWGHPARVRASARAQDAETAERLWQVSEDLTGVRFEALETAGAAGA
jgi:NAD(P)-dependent dehydrogenase (short-subunit alcohol dehydrogenase family)